VGKGGEGKGKKNVKDPSKKQEGWNQLHIGPCVRETINLRGERGTCPGLTPYFIFQARKNEESVGDQPLEETKRYDWEGKENGHCMFQKEGKINSVETSGRRG